MADQQNKPSLALQTFRKIKRYILKKQQVRQLRETQALLAHTRGYSFTADWMSHNIPRWDEHLAQYRQQPNLQMLEIGSYEGRSTLWFLENILTHATARITCIDPFSPNWSLRFDHNLRLSGVEQKVTKLPGQSGNILPTLARNGFDIIYIDGSHTAPDVLFDAISGWYLLKSGGTMIFDDYLWQLQSPVAERPLLAIDLFLEAFAGKYELLAREYQVLVRKL